MKKILILLSIFLLSISFLFVSCDNNANSSVPAVRSEATGKEITQDVFSDVMTKNNSIVTPVSELAPQVMNIIQNAKDLTFTAKISAKENSQFSFTTVDDYTKYKEYLNDDNKIYKPADSLLTPGVYEYINIEYKTLVQGEVEDGDIYSIKYKEKDGNEKTVNNDTTPSSDHLITDFNCLGYSITGEEEDYSYIDCAGLLSRIITIANSTSDISGTIAVSAGKKTYSLSFKDIVTGSDKKLTANCSATVKVADEEIGSGSCTVELTISDDLCIVEAENEGVMLGSFNVTVKDIDIKDADNNSLLTGKLDVVCSVNKDGDCSLKLGVALKLADGSISGNMVLTGNMEESSLYFALNDLNITEGNVAITGSLVCDIDIVANEYIFACSLSEKVGGAEYMAVELALDYSSDMEESILDAVKIYKLVIDGENYSADSLRAFINQMFDSSKEA